MNAFLLRSQCIAALTSAILLSLPMSASPQTKPHEIPLVLKNDPSGGDTGKKQTLIATVFGEPLYLEQLTPAEAEVKRKELSASEYDNWLHGFQVARTYDKIWGAVSRRYIEREKLEISMEELNAIVKSVEQQMKSEPERPEGASLKPEELQGISVAFRRASLMDWKVCKSLYEKYGGRVGIGSLGAWIALDGQHALLKEHFKAGDVKVHNTDIETAFWKYAQRDRFADTYPTGRDLKRMLSTPPYLGSDTGR